MKIALVGAESTGKSTLARELAARLTREGRRAAHVAEVLREWCPREGREPRPDEAIEIAREHERRIDGALAGADIVVADTTALMVAVYGALLFPGHPLLDFALDRQRGYDVTLVAGLDLPWVDDGLHRNAMSRERVDEQVRSLLQHAAIPYRVVYGTGPARLRHALACLPDPLRPVDPAPRGPWTWQCEKCSDPECEHRLFTSLTR